MLAGCAFGRGRGRPADPLDGLPDADKAWYRAWQRARADRSTFALRERLRLAHALVADPNMALRMTRVVATGDVDARVQESLGEVFVHAPNAAAMVSRAGA